MTNPKMKHVNWFDEPEIVARLVKLAKRDDRSFSSYVRTVLRDHLYDIGELPAKFAKHRK